MKFNRTEHQCWSCNEKLFQEPCGRLLVRVWCGYGRCASEAANKGATGETVRQAVARLEKRVEWENDLIP